MYFSINLYLLFFKFIEYDFGFVHVKAVDDAGHDKNLEKKMEFIEKSDKMIENLINSLNNDKKEVWIFNFFFFVHKLFFIMLRMKNIL